MTIPRCSLSVVLSLASLLPSLLTAAETPRWTRIGPDGGELAVIAAGPAGQLYAGTFPGSVFRSTDGAQSWSFAGVPGSALYDLAVDPKNPSTVYAATVEGLAKSTDRGATWTKVFSPPSGPTLTWRVVVDPKTPRIVWAAVFSGGLWKSVDGGRTWAELNRGLQGLGALAVDPIRPTTLYAGRLEGGVFKSVNGGSTWTRIERGLGPVSATSIAVDPRDSRNLLLGDSSGVFKSTDGGGRWRRSSAGLDASFVIALAYAPQRNGGVYAATRFDGVYRSLDGGATWQPARTGLAGLLNHVLATQTGVLVASERGVYASADRGRTWQWASQGLSALHVIGFAVDSQDPPRLYVGGPFRELFKSADRGGNWLALDTRIPIDRFTFAGPLALDPHDPLTVHALYERGFATSTNGGRRWAAHDFGCLQAGRMVIEPTIPATVYVNGGFVTVGCAFLPNACSSFRLDPNGERTCLRAPAIGGFGVPVFAADPYRPGTLYAKSNSAFFRSSDQGATWSLLSEVFLPGVLAFDPDVPGRVYGTFPGAVGRSLDGGASWELVEDGLPEEAAILSIAVDPSQPSTLYAATAEAVFQSLDSGASWELLAAAPEGIRLLQVVVDPVDPAILYAATENASVLRLDL